MTPGLQLGLGVRNFENRIRTESNKVGVEIPLPLKSMSSSKSIEIPVFKVWHLGIQSNFGKRHAPLHQTAFWVKNINWIMLDDWEGFLNHANERGIFLRAMKFTDRGTLLIISMGKAYFCLIKCPLILRMSVLFIDCSLKRNTWKGGHTR